MKINISCVYWILLIISVVSSGLLFIIVASEGIKISKEQSSIDLSEANNLKASDNVAIINSEGGAKSDQAESLSSDGELPRKIKGRDKTEDLKKEKTDHRVPELKIIKSIENTENLPGLELFPEGFTQQPNLSQGVLETDQAAVLNLVDAAAAELQSLASDPRISLDNNNNNNNNRNNKITGKSVVSNNLSIASLRDSDNAHHLASSSSSSSSSSSTSRLQNLGNIEHQDKSLENLQQNLTIDDESGEGDNIQDDFLHSGYEGDDIDVLVVRADQSGTTSTETPLDADKNDDHSLPFGLTATQESLETTSELPDIEARARLNAAATEDAGIIIDVLIPGSGTDPHEDIPSFSEWAQKRLEEAEKKKTHPNASAQNPGGPGGRGTGSTKVRSKNYASPDCGSKIVAANPEAGSASSVLSSSRDEYMLNTCTSRVWFVVELCEAIQAEKIELANFELFSSSPKDFSVFVGDRFPSRDWSAVGQFTAKDERDIQSFPLHPRLFGKFVKVELHSHYGSEHFCPVSLFRVYGTSEFEVLETENQIQESIGELEDPEDEEEMLDIDSGDSPRNLFGSARDAVLSIVKKAAEVLVKSGDTSNNNTKIQESIEDTILQNSLVAACMTPRYSVLCNDCEEATFAKVFQLVSCNDQYLEKILNVDFINKTLYKSSLCRSLGVVNKETREYGDFKNSKNDHRARFLYSLFPSQYIFALCNVLAARESRVIVNTSFYITGNNSEEFATMEDALIKPPQGVPTTYEGSTPSAGDQQSTYCTIEDNSQACKNLPVSLEQIKYGSKEFLTPKHSDDDTTMENIATLIKPTKTLSRDDVSKKEQPLDPLLEATRKPADESTFFEAPASPSLSPNLQATLAEKVIEEPANQGGGLFETVTQNSPITTSSIENNQEIGEALGDSEFPEAASPEIEVETETEREQEPKILSQDQISLDSLLSDLTDLEADSVTSQNNPATPSATISQPTPNPQQKESVFLRLSNRIKTLERNMSLSGQYLEELSKRYKKQVEEMQRSLERAITVMGEESRKSEEREARRLEEISYLRDQVSNLTISLNSILNDKDYWSSKFSLIGQHVVIVCVEIVIVLLVLSYCRRTAELDYDTEGSTTANTNRPRITRRKSVESTTKKTKRRRPSEIASHISGTYGELMINDQAASNETTRKDKRRKKRREFVGSKTPGVTISDFQTIRPVRRESFNALPGGTNFPTRRASSSDASKCPERSLIVNDFHQRPESAPENSSGWFSDQKKCKNNSNEFSSALVKEDETIDIRNIGIEDINYGSRSSSDVAKPDGDIDQRIINSGLKKQGGILKNRKLSSPSFMKTALGSRSKRLIVKNDSSSEISAVPILKSDNWEWYSRNSLVRSSQEDNNRGSPSPPSVNIRIENNEGFNGASSPSLSSRINGKSHDDSDDSRSESATPTHGFRKDKKTYGIKKMVKKFF